MNVSIWVPLAVALVSAVPASRALLTIRHDRKIGLRDADRADREQESISSDRLMARMENLLKRYEERAERAEHELSLEQAYTAILDQHIRDRRPPPSPARPTD